MRPYRMSYHIVVARYNESVTWLDSQAEHVILFNKGEPLGRANEIPLPNVGREADTYLQYVLRYYESLPDVVIFTQAKISDHLGSDDVSHLLQFRDEALAEGKSIAGLYEWVPNDTTDMGPRWNYRFGTYYLVNNYKENQPVMFDDWFKKVISPQYPQPLCFYPNALFSVKRELILNHDRAYYQRLLAELQHSSTPPEAHFFERSWFYIFD